MAKKLPYSRKEAKAWANATISDWYGCPITPITQDFALDEAGIRENLEAYVEMKENALVVGGFIAEGWNMKLSDWKRYHEIMADASRGRLPLWTIILDPSVHQALEKMHFVQELGYLGVEVINPVVQLRSDDEIFDYYKYLTDNSDLAVFLYRTAVSGKLMNFDLMAKLSKLETVVGAKQGSLNHSDTLALRKVVQEGFIVSDPDEYWWLDDIRNGGKVIWAHFIHSVYGKKRTILEEYTRLARQGRYEEAYQKWSSLQPVRDLLDKVFLGTLQQTASYATATGYIKAWHEAMGLKAGPMLPPVKNLSTEKKEWLRAELKRVGVI
jgi:4-hydroxy-tetrahydrodipicolinate synthase